MTTYYVLDDYPIDVHAQSFNHYRVYFRINHPEKSIDIHNVGTIYIRSIDKVDNFLYWTNEKEYSIARKWFDWYFAKFHNRRRAYPQPVDFYSEDSVFVPYESDEYIVRNEHWIWILQNCRGEVRYTDNIWFFASKEDAILFRLRK